MPLSELYLTDNVRPDVVRQVSGHSRTSLNGQHATSILSDTGYTSLLTVDFQSVPGRILAAIEAMA
jgi:hypothetical protein